MNDLRREAHSDDGRKILHEPVLLSECVDALRPCPGGLYADLTLGGGGHARAVLEYSAPSGFLIGLDRDPEILVEAKKSLKIFEKRTLIEHGNFCDAAGIFEEHLGKADGVIMDLGLSSLQLDRASRGFSLFKDGPLDFRMDTTQALTGKEFVNRGREEDLLFAIGRLGEEPRAKAVVRALLAERQKRPLLHTSDVRGVVERVYGRKSGKIHPATRTFQGLRMFVNKELESLQGGLEAGFRLLRTGGRMVLISFHSGEDRIVKEFIRDCVSKEQAHSLGRKPIRPGDQEVRRNRRSRSARMRVLEKR